MSRSVAAKEKETENLLVSCFVMRCLVVVLLLVMPICQVSASLAAGGTDFEIPISELSKSKKESPQKQDASEPKKKKKNSAKYRTKKTKEKKDPVAQSQELIAEAVAPAKTADQVKSPGSEPKTDVPGEATSQAVLITAASIKENVSISHIADGFVVANKSTVINAVIYTREVDPREVNCTVRVTETGPPSVVKMVKVDGTRFTYTANLPGLAPDVSSLRYTIVVTDSLGKESSSPEFVTPVKVTPVVPSWQF